MAGGVRGVLLDSSALLVADGGGVNGNENENALLKPGAEYLLRKLRHSNIPTGISYGLGLPTLKEINSKFDKEEFSAAKVDPLYQFSKPVAVDFADILDLDSLGFNVKRYDPDPAAKAAAATVLASKLGADSGLKVYMGDDTKFNPPTRMSSDVEHVQSSGLRKRKQSVSRSSSAESAVLHQLEEEMMQYTGPEGPEMSKHNQLIVEHQNPTNLHTQDGGWIARIAALLVGEDPTQSYALICGNCHMHNGLARKEDFPYITYYCPHCKALNRPKQVEGHASDSLSPNMDTSLVSSPIMGPSTPLGDVSMVQSAGGSMSDKASDSSSPMAAVVESIEETEPIVPKSHVS